MAVQNANSSKLETVLSVGTGLAGVGLTGLCLYEPALTPYLGLGAAAGAVIAGITSGRVAECTTGAIAGAAGAATGVILDPDCSLIANGVAACATSMCASIVSVTYVENPLKFARNVLGTVLVGSSLLYGYYKF
ncbi:MAG: hypothetical protein WCI72_00150 [archaeon]